MLKPALSANQDDCSKENGARAKHRFGKRLTSPLSNKQSPPVATQKLASRIKKDRPLQKRKVVRHKVGRPKSPLQNSNFSFKVKHSGNLSSSVVISSTPSKKATKNCGDLGDWTEHVSHETFSEDDKAECGGRLENAELDEPIQMVKNILRMSAT